MFVIYLDISFYNELKTIFPGKIDRIVEGVTKSAFKALETAQPFPRLYTAPSDSPEDNVRFISALLRAIAALTDAKEDLLGAKILASHTGEEQSAAEVFQKELSYLSLSTFQDYRVWLTPNLEEYLRSYIKSRKLGENFFLVSQHSVITLSEKAHRFFEKEKLAAPVKGLILHHHYSQEPPEICYVYGPQDEGKDLLVEATETSIKENEFPDAVPWVKVFGKVAPFDSLETFLSSISISFLDGITEDLLTPEQWTTWETKGLPFFKYLLHSPTMSHKQNFLVIDFKDYYLIYLRAYISFCRKKVVPAVIVFSGVAFFDETSISFINEILHTLIEDNGLIPIFVGEDLAYVNRFEGFNKTFFECPCLSEETAQHYIQKARPGSEVIPASRLLEEAQKQLTRIDIFHFSLLSPSAQSLVLKGMSSARRELIKTLSPHYLEILYVISIAGSLLPREELPKFFLERRHFRHAEIADTLKNLCASVLISDKGRYLANYSLAARIKGCLGDGKAQDLSHAFAQYVHDLFESGLTHIQLHDLFLYEEQYGSVDVALRLYFDTIEADINAERFDDAKRLLRENFFTSSFLTQRQTRDYTFIILAKSLHAYIITQDESFLKIHREANEIITPNPSDALESPYANALGVQLAQQAAMRWETEKTIRLSKDAVFNFQRLGDDIGAIKAFWQLGLATLQRGRAGQITDQLEIALSIAQRSSLWTYYQLHSYYLLSMALELIGQYTEAKVYLKEATDCAKKNYFSLAQLIFTLSEIRIEHALGNYELCRELSEKSLAVTKRYNDTQGSALFTVTLATSLAYLGETKQARKVLEPLESRDALFARGESYILDKNFEQAALVFKELAAYKVREVFRPESFDLRSSLTAYHGCITPLDKDESVPQIMLVKAFSLYAREKLKAGSSLEEADHLTQSQALRPSSSRALFPYKAEIYYLCSLAIEKDDPQRATSYLHMASNLVTKTAAEIHSQGEKNSYFRKNYWNALILQASAKSS